MLAVKDEQERERRRQASREQIAASRARYPQLANDADESRERFKAAQQREQNRVDQILARDKQPAPPKKPRKGKSEAVLKTVEPTPEWLQHFNAVRESPTTSSGFKMGRVYRREPWFESLLKRDDAFTGEDLAALRYYRNTFEHAQHSETKCSLASMVHGSGSGNGEPSLAVARAKSTLAFIDPLLGPLAETVRLIAIHDFTYEQVAMGRFGYRYADYYDGVSGTFMQRPKPKSGRHPGLIKDEFLAGCRRLTAAVNRRPVENLAANADFPGLERVSDARASSAPQRLTDRLRGDIARRRNEGRPVGSIDLSLTDLRDLCRENDLPCPPDDAESGWFEGLPVRVNRPFGWVLNDVGEE